MTMHALKLFDKTIIDRIKDVNVIDSVTQCIYYTLAWVYIMGSGDSIYHSIIIVLNWKPGKVQ